MLSRRRYVSELLTSAISAANPAAQGGIITHEYTIIKGFAAKASEQALDTVQALGKEHDITVEADQVVSINDEKS